jgi:hypothetical protein
MAHTLPPEIWQKKIGQHLTPSDIQQIRRSSRQLRYQIPRPQLNFQEFLTVMLEYNINKINPSIEQFLYRNHLSIDEFKQMRIPRTFVEIVINLSNPELNIYNKSVTHRVAPHMYDDDDESIYYKDTLYGFASSFLRILSSENIILNEDTDLHIEYVNDNLMRITINYFNSRRDELLFNEWIKNAYMVVRPDSP